MITKKIILYWTTCSLVLVFGIHFLDRMPVIMDWAGFLIGVFFGILFLIILSIILSVILAAFPFKENRTPNKKEISVFIPASSVALTIIAIITFLATRPSYNQNAAEPELCHLVRYGKFQLNEFLILREENIQTETNSFTKQKLTYKVNWLTPCEFDLTNIEDANDITRVKIISVTNESYEVLALSGKRVTKHDISIIQKETKEK